MEYTEKPMLEVRNLTKKFQHITANADVSFDVAHGEIHCLLGENGAGKSTLAECIYGYYKADAGAIYIEGQQVNLKSPAEAIRHGIGMVHQHFVMVPSMNAIENIAIGKSGREFGPGLEQVHQAVSQLCERYAVDLDLHAKVWQLPVGKQQWVEIFKALYHGARLLILDEPSAVLTPQESDQLFRILRSMAAEGMAIILISHKFQEVMQSDRVTVLRKGKKIATVSTAATTREELTGMMIGRQVSSTRNSKAMETEGEVILQVNQLRALSDRGQEALRGVDLTIRAGEIVGIAGVAGNGQKELFESLLGVRHATAGSVKLCGKEVLGQSCAEIQNEGVGFIPDDRFSEGLVPDFSIAENLILGHESHREFSRRGFLDIEKIRAYGRQAIDSFKIAAHSENAVTRTLSGGNAQKIILAREFDRGTRLLLANQPSRGLDIGVIETIHTRLLERREMGLAVLVASEELEELLALADRIVVMFKGEIKGVFSAADARVEEIGLLMAGHELAEVPA